ncbi:class B sortase [Caproiciproducens sp. R2]|uniref:class B sortase n=1 Tax=Caproiciproducens sp. R2 TaxID=3435187 RepID=UPI004034C926
MKPQNGERTKKRVPFYRVLLPWKGDGKKLILYKTVSLIAVCVFLGCALYLAWDLVVLPAAADTEQQDIKSVYYAESSETPDTGDDSPVSSTPPERDGQGRLVRFLELQKINPSIVGWIKVPGTVIDLPVLQADAKDPEFYLTHDYRGRYSGYGSVFADARCSVEKGKSRSIVLYGHSLNSGRMFTQLDRYKSLDFYKKNPVFTFDTVDSQSQWKVISVFLTNTLPEQGKPFNYMKTDFQDDSDFLNFVYQMRIRSLYNTGVGLNKDDSIVLLSTCSYEFKDFREVVVARKVRDGESGEVDVSRAVYNGKTVYPDCWYTKNGGKKPVWPDTYEEAVKKNLLSWGEGI